MFRLRVSLCVVCCACVVPQTVFAGGWLYPEGHGQAIFTTEFAQARNVYDASGSLVPSPPYRKLETRVYAEHGVTDWLTVIGQGSGMAFHGGAGPAEYVDAFPFAPQQPQYRGLGLGAVGARLHLMSLGDREISVETSLRGASDAARRYLDMREPPQVDARVLMGQTFDAFGFDGFLDTQVGFRTRGQYGSEYRMDVTIGLRPFEPLTLMAQNFTALAAWNGPKGSVMEQKVALSAVFDASDVASLQIGWERAVGGINAPAVRGLFAALWLRY
jgi:protein XagA